MSSINIERAKLDTTNTYAATIGISTPTEVSNNYYIPITVDNFAGPDINVTGVTAVTGESKLKTTVAGGFDNVRVGDIVKYGATTTFAAISDGSLDVVLSDGSKVVSYDSTLTSSNVPVKAGDFIEAVNLPANTSVDKIDYANHLLYLSAAATASAVETATIKYVVRVTAVRPSTQETVSTRNEIDINTTVGTGATGDTVVIGNGTREALLAAIRIAPTGSDTNGTMSLSISVYKAKGTEAKATNNGTGASDYTAYTYVGLGSISTNLDEFLVDARLPRQ